MKSVLLATALLVLGCKSGDGLIVVSVGASPPVTGVASLHVTMTIGPSVRTHEVTDLPSGTIAAASNTTFGIDATAGSASTMTIQVDARDSMSKTIPSGSQANVAIHGGKRTDVTVTLSGAVQVGPDMGSPDGGGPCLFDNAQSTLDTCVFGQ
jgi:hypothetical protein